MFATFGADTTLPSLSLFISHALPADQQAMGGALLNAFGQFGRIFGLAIATATQTAVVAHQKGISIEDVGAVKQGDKASLAGLRAANWLNFAFGICAFAIVAIAFRGKGVIVRK